MLLAKLNLLILQLLPILLNIPVLFVILTLLRRRSKMRRTGGVSSHVLPTEERDQILQPFLPVGLYILLEMDSRYDMCARLSLRHQGILTPL